MLVPVSVSVLLPVLVALAVMGDLELGPNAVIGNHVMIDRQAELSRCEYCEEKPCKAACPADCSPADFIMAARVGAKSDYRRAGALIMGSNPLGWICGVVCPDYFCMKACSRGTFDKPINIPAVQASVMKRAYEAGLGSFKAPDWNGKRVAVIGAGPAGGDAARPKRLYRSGWNRAGWPARRG